MLEAQIHSTFWLTDLRHMKEGDVPFLSKGVHSPYDCVLHQVLFQLDYIFIGIINVSWQLHRVQSFSPISSKAAANFCVVVPHCVNPTSPWMMRATIIVLSVC